MVFILIATLIAVVVALRWPIAGIVLACNGFLFEALATAAGGAESAIAGVLMPGAVIGAVLCLSASSGALSKYAPDLIDALVLLLLLLCLASASYADAQVESVLHSVRLLLVGMSSYFAAKLAFSICGASSALNQFYGGNLACALFFGVGALMFGESTHSYTMRLTLGSSSHIALSMALGLGVVSGAILMITHRRGGASQAALTGMLALIGYALLLTNTRSVLLGIAVAALVVLLVKPTVLFSSGGFRAILLIGMASAGLGAIVFYRFNLVERAFEGVVGLAVGSLGASEIGRLVLWQRALEDFLSEPFKGKGAGMFEYVNGVYPHNIFLETGADLGMVGLVLLMALLGAAFLKCVSKSTPQKRGLLMVLIFTLFVAQVSLALWMQKMLFMTIGLISGVAAYSSKRCDELLESDRPA